MTETIQRDEIVSPRADETISSLCTVSPYVFEEPLREGVILGRPNRFIMEVELDGERARCHCPVVSRIGGIDTTGRPCLVSRSDNPRRKFSRTVEAFSWQEPGDAEKRWVGINQTASNRYVAHFLEQGALAGLAPGPGELRREVRFGESRLDFAIADECFIEVKTPLAQLECDIPPFVPRLDVAPFSSTGRALRHLRELADSLGGHQRAVVLYCLYYENHGFRFLRGTTFDEVERTVTAVQEAGVELWQCTFGQDAHEVRLMDCRPLEDW